MQACLVSCHGDVAGDCFLDLSLLESRIVAVVEAVEGAAFDLRAWVGDGNAIGAGEASGIIEIGVRQDSGEDLAIDAGLTGAEVRLEICVVDTDRFRFRRC